MLRKLCFPLVLFVGFGLSACVHQSLPPATTKVTLYRDSWGVPHIYSDVESAGYYGLGYAQAEDRLEVLLMTPMWVRGRSAEILGDSALAMDIEMRRWRHAEAAEAGFKRLQPQLRENYRAFVAGVKQYMAEHPEQVPAWAPDLTAVDLVALGRAAYWAGYVISHAPEECAKGGAPLAAQGVAAGARLQADSPIFASNGWAVMPSRTVDGSTILLADPHVAMRNPMYYEYRMHAGELHSAGFAMGALLWQAHNEHVGWAMTTGYPDTWDCYEVVMERGSDTAYRYDDAIKQLEVRHERFRSSSGKQVDVDFKYSRHNGVLSPVVAEAPGRVYVVSTSQMDDAGLFDNEIYQMNHADTVEGVRAAMQSLGMWSQNLIVADDRNNVWYVRAGKTPRRPPGDYNWGAVVPGNSSATAWQGFYTLADAVQLSNPEEGFVQNNNTSPQQMYGTDRLSADDYPAELFNDSPVRTTTRSIRALQVLSAARNFGVDDAMALAFDEKWITTPQWQMALRSAVQRLPEQRRRLSPGAAKLLKRILDFNGHADKTSVAALNMYFWVAALGDQLVERPELKAYQSWPWTEQSLGDDFLHGVLAALETAATQQRAAAGSLDARLGDYFRVGVKQRQALGGATLKPAGQPECESNYTALCDSTLRAFRFRDNGDDTATALRGSQAMRLMVIGDGVRSWTLYAVGQSQHPDSPHFEDQATLFSDKQMKPSWFARSELLDQLESVRQLSVPAEFR